MFKTKSAKGGETRQRILEVALRLFREAGFEATTMREVAAAADQSLGAAYHYFPSKEAIVLAYYHSVQDEHARQARQLLSEITGLRERVAAVLNSKLEILAADRPLMGALLRFTGEPAHPLSFLGPGTRDLQLRSMALFRDALERERLPQDLRSAAPLLLWALHMGVLLYLLYDTSPRQRQTRALADGAITLFVRALALARLPVFIPFRRGVLKLLDEAGLVAAPADLDRAAAMNREVTL